jgi:hypothetical protein
MAEIIRHELEQNDAREYWEGIYYGGLPALNERMTRLFLSKKRGYLCLRTHAEDTGTIRQNGSHLILTSDHGDWGPGHCTDAKEFVLVPWGARLYLIEVTRIVEFCNAVNAGDEPRTEAQEPFLLREDDWKKKVKGWPSIPKPWQERYLIKSPVECVVRTVGEYSESIPVPEYPYTKGALNGIRCTINAGKEKGVLPGMTLLPKDPNLRCTGYILSVSDGSSEMLVSRYWEREEKMKKLLGAAPPFSTRKAMGAR